MNGLGSKLALIVGNGTYDDAPLKNATDDARAMASRLEELGFTVRSGIDLTLPAFREMLRSFDKLDGEFDGIVFYFAGHGLQLENKNFLIPVDAQIDTPSDVTMGTISLDDIITMLTAKAETSIIFLDACRTNPFVKNLQRRRGTRSRDLGVSAGLAEVEKRAGVFIAYATAPGKVASDGDGEHSPFTTALLEHIGTPGVTMGDLMIDVRNAVLEATLNEQQPWDSSSLTQRFYFVEPSPAPVVAPTIQQLAAQAKERWTAIQNASSPSVLTTFAEQYPFEPWISFVDERINELREFDAQRAAVVGRKKEAAPLAWSTAALQASTKGALGGQNMIAGDVLVQLVQIYMFSTARLVYHSGRALASALVVKGSDLSGALGDGLIVLTAGHALVGPHGSRRGIDVADTRLHFEGLVSPDSKPEYIAVKEVLWWSAPDAYDAAILAPEWMPGEVRALPVARDLPELPADEAAPLTSHPRVVSISYPFGGPVHFGIFNNYLIDYQRPTREEDGRVVQRPVWLHYTAASEPGSSGCPILDHRLAVIGMHSRGSVAMPRLNDKQGVYAANAGVWIQSIAAAVDTELRRRGSERAHDFE